MSRVDLINAIASGDVKKIIELQQQADADLNGRVIFANLNDNDTWDIPILGLHEVNKTWIQSGKYMGLTYEVFAALIVKHEFQVMANGYYVNHKFPEHSDAYVPPDLNETPELKYQRILNDLKEVAALWRERLKTGKIPMNEG
jgi:hypothetical protein